MALCWSTASSRTRIFTGALGSGLVKMCVIGLGKRAGAAAMHAGASRFGYERVIRRVARAILGSAPILGGVAILENQCHDTAKLVVLAPENFESGEADLLVESRQLMPSLPFDELDLLIVDRLGKNISGAGIDPNVTGRWVHGYSSLLARGDRPAPFIRRIFVRDLSPETHGNAIGIGLADFTTTRLVRSMDQRVTYLNVLTALSPHCAKIHCTSTPTVIRSTWRSPRSPWRTRVPRASSASPTHFRWWTWRFRNPCCPKSNGTPT